MFPGFLTPVLTLLFFQSHRLLFSHASAEVSGENTPKKSRLNLGSNSQPPGHESNMLTTEPPRRVKVKYCNFFISRADNSSSSGPIKSIIKLTQDLMVTYILTKFGADWLIFVHASA